MFPTYPNALMTSKNLCRALLLLMAVHAAWLVFYHNTDGLAHFAFYGLDTFVNFHVENSWVGKNYYAELARGFSQLKLGFAVLPPQELLDHANPYGGDAATSGLIIQDASLYRDRYFLYYGPPPVILFYMPIYYLFGIIPTDGMILSVLSVIYICFVYHFSEQILKTSKLTAAVFFIGFVYNPIMISHFMFYTCAGVSRLFVVLCLILGFRCLLRLSRHEPVKNAEIAFVLVSMALAAATRPSYLIEYIVILLLMLYFSRASKIGIGIGIGVMLSTIVLCLKLIYNFLRFHDPLENGQRFIVNGIDFRENSIIDLPSSVLSLMHNYLYRIYEYFFAPPNYTGSEHLLNRDTLLPASHASYSEGVIGYFWFNPSLLILILVLLVPIISKRSFRRDEIVLIGFGAFLVAFNFLLLTLIPGAANHFGLELIPKLMLFCYALLYCKGTAKIRFSILPTTLILTLLLIPIDGVLSFRKL